jgi:hypothetical protein
MVLVGEPANTKKVRTNVFNDLVISIFYSNKGNGVMDKIEPTEETDKAIEYLKEASSILSNEREYGDHSRQLSITLAYVDTAILWRSEHLKQKKI